MGVTLMLSAQNNPTAMNLYDIALQDIDGNAMDLSAYKGKKNPICKRGL